MNNPFGDLIPAGRSSPRQAPPEPYRIPDPRADAREARDIRGTQNDDVKTDIAVEANDRARSGETFTRENTYRDEYNRDTAVMSYRNASRSFAAALDAADTREGDINVIYAFAKIMDPESVVRESETAMAESGQNLAEQTAAQIGFQLGAGGGRMSRDARQRLLRELHTRVASYNTAYNATRQRYRQNSQEYGISPERVIGEHAGEAYRQQVEDALRRQPGAIDPLVAERALAARSPDNPNNPGSGRFTGVGNQDDEAGAGMRLPTEQEQAFNAFVRSKGRNLTLNDMAQWQLQNVPGAQITPQWAQQAQAFVDGARRGDPIGSGVDYSVVDQASTAEMEARARESGLREQGGGGFGQTADAAVRGAADVVSLGFADEIAAAGDTLFGGGTMADNLDYQRYIDDRDSEQNGVARIAGQVAGGFALPVGRLGTGTRGLAAEGAAFGGAYGFGSGEGSVGDRLATGAAGAAGGAVVGGALGKAGEVIQPRLASYLTQRANSRQQSQAPVQEFAEAALRNPEVPVMRADVPSSSGEQIATAIADRTAFGGMVTRARDRGAKALGAQAETVASRFGPTADRAGAGEAAQAGARSFVTASQGRVGKAYEAIPIDAATPAALDATRDALATLNSRFSSNPDIAAALRDNRLATFQRALSEGNGLSWQDLKAFRSTIGEIVEGPVLSESTSRSSMRQLYSALSDDMRATAAAQGPQALAAFNRANNAASERFATIDNVITPILGNDGSRSATSAFERIQSWAQDKGGDHARLARLMRAMPADEAGVVRSTLIARLGEATPGAQNAVGDQFSPSTFLTNWSKMSDRAKSVLFDGEHRQALDDIATLAGGMREGRRFSNSSETTRGTFIAGTLFSVLNAIGGGIADTATAGATVGGQYALSRIMANPRSARWLTALARKPNPQAQRAHVMRLEAIARSEPAIANDILGLQQRLLESFGQSPSRAAAEDEPDAR